MLPYNSSVTGHSNLPSGEYQNRSELIDAHYGRLVQELQSEVILDTMAPYLQSDIQATLRVIPTKEELARRIVHIVKQNISNDIYNVFMTSLSQFQPQLFALITQNADQNSSLHSSLGFGGSSSIEYSSSDFQRRSEAIGVHYDILVERLPLNEIARGITPYLTMGAQKNIAATESLLDVKRKIINIVKQNTSSKLYLVFMDILSQTQIDLYNKINWYSTQNPNFCSSASGSPSDSLQDMVSLQSLKASIEANYGFLIFNIQAENIFESMRPNLENAELKILRKSGTGSELARGIIDLLKHDKSLRLCKVFLGSLFRIQPQLYEKLKTKENYLTNPLGSMSFGMKSGIQHREPPTKIEIDRADEPKQTTHKRSYDEPHHDIDDLGSAMRSVELGSLFSKRDRSTDWGTSNNGQTLRAEEEAIDRIQVTNILQLQNSKARNVDEVNLLKTNLSNQSMDALCNALKGQRTIISFHFSGRELNTSSVQQLLLSLKNLENMDSMSLVNVACFDEFNEWLKTFLIQLKNITRLSLSQSNMSIGTWGLVAGALSTMSKLTRLYLDDMGLGDTGAIRLSEALRSIPDIKRLNLERNRISDHGIKFISDSLCTCISIEYMSVAGNQVSDEGTLALGNMIKSLTTKCEINLSDNQIGNSGASQILRCGASREVRRKFIFDNNQIRQNIHQDKMLKQLMQNSEVRLTGNAFGNRRVKAIIDRLSRGETFRLINLNNMDLNDPDIEMLCKFLSANGVLEVLKISKNNLTDKSLAPLTQLFHRSKNLQCIDITGNKFTNPNDVQAFGEKLTEIRKEDVLAPFFLRRRFWEIVDKANQGSLFLNEEELGGNSIQILFAIIENVPLREMHFESCTLNKCDIEIISKHAVKFSDVTESLVFSHNSFTNQQIETLSGAYPDLKQSIVGRIFGGSSNAPSFNLKKLVVQRNEIKEKGIKQIATTILRIPSLTLINLSANKMGSQGTKQLCSFLKENPLLRSLSLANNGLEDDGSDHISQMLSSNSNLRHLNLANNGITSNGARHLTSNGMVEFLDLSGNHIGELDKGFKTFCAEIGKSTCLTTLKLGSNSITDSNVQVLLTNLSSNRSITKLDLNKNQMGIAGCQGTLQILVAGRLTHLDISSQIQRLNWRTKDLSVFFNALTSREKPLYYLGLRNLQITAVEAEKFAKGIGECNQRLELKEDQCPVLDLSLNNIQGRKELRRLVKIRMDYKSPRSIFDNEKGDMDFFSSPV